MRDLLPFLVVGLTTGALYGLAGVGLVLTYRTSGVFNFAHGAVAAAAAFLFYSLHVKHGWGWPLAAVVTLIAFGIVGGLVLELIARTLADTPPAAVVVVTVGAVLAIEGALYLIYGDTTLVLPQFLPQHGITVSTVNITYGQMISAAVSLAAALALYAMLKLSRVGAAMRAVVDDPNLVRLTGETPEAVRRTAWAIGCSFAALSGILLAPTLGLDANLLTLLVIQAFGACAIGRFSSLPLTFAGGLIVGVVASVATKYFTTEPFNGLPAAVPLVVLVIVLLVVPTRKLPGARIRLRALAADIAPMSKGRASATGLAAVVLLAAVPHVVGTKLPVWINGLDTFVIFISLALLVWTSGQISLCHASFVALGATSISHLQAQGMPWFLALIIGGLLTVPVGAIVAIPALRLSGIYLALVTLGFGIFMQDVVFNSFLMFGAPRSASVRRPDWGPFTGSDTSTYYVALGVAVLAAVALAAVQRGRLGRLLRAMAETPTLLTTSGLGLPVTRLLVFCLSAFIAGVGGGLVVTQFSSVSGQTYGPITSLLYVAILALGGTRLIRSAVIAAALSAVVPGYVTNFDTDKQLLVFGLVAIIAGLVIANRPALNTWVRRMEMSSAAKRADHSPLVDRFRRARSSGGTAEPVLRELVGADR